MGQIVGLVGVRYGVIGQENVSYIMLVSMSAFLVAVVRTPLTAIVLITEITGHFEVTLGQNPYKGDDIPIAVAKRDQVSAVIEV